jgi:imidazolonepropionase
LNGRNYLEIAEIGGGIWSTVSATREATLNELEQLTIERANELLKQGVTVIEVKSGYGLSVEEEIKMLKAIKKADDGCNPDLISTCLAAHILPKDFQGNKAEYLDYILLKLLPEVTEQNLSKGQIFLLIVVHFH